MSKTAIKPAKKSASQPANIRTLDIGDNSYPMADLSELARAVTEKYAFHS